MYNKSRRNEHIKDILWGVLLALGCFLFWYALVGNPFNEYSLIKYGELTDGRIIECSQEIDSDDRGGLVINRRCKYEFETKAGLTIEAETEDLPRRLEDNFHDIDRFDPVKIRYLPYAPETSKMEGAGAKDLFEWTWRKLIGGFILLLIFILPSVFNLSDRIKDFIKFIRKPNS